MLSGNQELSRYALGTKRPEAPADVIGNVANAMRILNGEDEDFGSDDGKAPATRSLDRRGSEARPKSQSTGGNCQEDRSIKVV
jgi:hypothetical protein